MEESHQLPSNFDLLVVGTGVIESVVSAAASRIGKTVLQIDRDDFYGGHWASFNLELFHGLPNIINTKDVVVEVAQDLPCQNDLFNLENFSSKWYIPKYAESDEKYDQGDNSVETDISSNIKESASNVEDKNTCSKQKIFSQDDLLSESRKFNIDLAPKLNFARGNYVELLISSNIARYSEYRSVSRVLTWINGHLEVVPCSRSDVFANNNVSVIEKRILMKLLTCLDDDSENLKGYESKTFLQFLKDKKLTPNLIHYVLYAISMSSDDTPCLQGVERTKRFLKSLGRFGKTPFLFSMYGSGETAQAFCRLSAVFGGVYALKQPLQRFTLQDEKFSALICGTQQISADHFVLGVSRSPPKYVKNVKKEYIARAVFITDRSVMDSEKEHLTLLMYPPENGKNLITLIELGCLTGVCPQGFYLVHLISRQKENPQDDLRYVVENIFNTDFKMDHLHEQQKPQILWSAYFSLPDINNVNLNENTPENVFLCSGPDLDLDYDECMRQAQVVFEKLYPDSEFLPRAPDPEEIIIEGEDQNEEANDLKEKENHEEALNDIKDHEASLSKEIEEHSQNDKKD